MARPSPGGAEALGEKRVASTRCLLAAMGQEGAVWREYVRFCATLGASCADLRIELGERKSLYCRVLRSVERGVDS